VPSLLERFIGVPLTLARQREEVLSHLRFRDRTDLRATVSEGVSHITQKSGALLAAQAIFLVVDTYGIDHGWPQLAVTISILTLITAALLVMGNLHSVYLGAPPAVDDPVELEVESIVQMARLAGLRGARFNIALYLTFLSVILLGFGAFEASIGYGT
jgi:hypothetical protein